MDKKISFEAGIEAVNAGSKSVQFGRAKCNLVQEFANRGIDTSLFEAQNYKDAA